ncbi:nucleoside/nucleotide kinase family protein [Pseudogemmobacter sp. CC-YST710]|uniref:Nucleoside/nucleotide kinase family protein n=2 Tax=Pseudogemmobacter faecipullorum TaxID=2755041 RepID=A0ABS8CNE7_9RHOB|nr:nucleoside/nucleotide kinase family protein [Pseudogemmobacter faecipullorum]
MARRLAERLSHADILQADGYHYDNILLDHLGLRHRKGVAETFDIPGLAAMLHRIRAGEEVITPVFDRRLDLVRGAAGRLLPEIRHVVVEGNYLALASGPWAQLRPLFDLTAYIEVPEEELRRRLTQRWTDLGCSGAEVAEHVDGNDMINAELIREQSLKVDFTLRN